MTGRLEEMVCRLQMGVSYPTGQVPAAFEKLQSVALGFSL